MARIENDWLETFTAVAEQGSFSAAGPLVHRSQSRISAHVAALEHALGRSLFDRRHRPIELTDAGEAFLPHAYQALTALSRGADAVSSLTGIRRGRVVLGTHPSVSAGFLPGLLTEFAAANPEVQVELSEDTTAGIGESLVSGRLHLAIRSMTSNSPSGPIARPLWREPYVAVLGEEAALAREPGPLTPEQLANTDLIIIARPGLGIDPDTAGVLRRWGLTPRVAWRTEQPQTLANLVKAGLGVGIINFFAMAISETSGLTVTQVGDVDDGRVVGLWHDPERYMSSATLALYDHIVAAPIPPGTLPVDRSLRGLRPR